MPSLKCFFAPTPSVRQPLFDSSDLIGGGGGLQFVEEASCLQVSFFAYSCVWEFFCLKSEKSSCPQNFCPQFWGRKWARQFYGRLEKCVLSAGKKTHVHKTPRFRFFFGGGGGSADFIFMGARIFWLKMELLLLILGVFCRQRPGAN